MEQIAQLVDNSTIITFLSTHAIDIVICVGVCLIVYGLLRKNILSDKGKLTKVLYLLVIEAEKALGSKTGEIKKQQVISNFMTRYPVLSIFVTEEEISKAIDIIVFKINNYLKNHDATLSSMEEELKNQQEV